MRVSGGKPRASVSIPRRMSQAAPRASHARMSMRHPRMSVAAHGEHHDGVAHDAFHMLEGLAAQGFNRLSTTTVIADTAVQRSLDKVGLRGKAFKSAFWISVPAALLSVLIRFLAEAGFLPWWNQNNDNFININTAVWTSITGVLGFLLVFRASQAYTRYWQGLTAVHLMQAEWFDACSALSSFCSTSDDPEIQAKVKRMKHTLTRLFSMLSAAAMLMLLDHEDNFNSDIELLGLDSLDRTSVYAYKKSVHRVELVSQWIQHGVLKGMQDGVIVAASPIVTRAYQELANGLVIYYDALKVKTLSFPKQYQAVCEVLLAIHWIVTPLLVNLWVNSAIWAAVFTFIDVFTLWSLSGVSVGIEVPFFLTDFVSDAKDLQDRFNHQLLVLLHPICTRFPTLIPNAKGEPAEEQKMHQTPVSWLLSLKDATTYIRDIGGMTGLDDEPHFEFKSEEPPDESVIDEDEIYVDGLMSEIIENPLDEIEVRRAPLERDLSIDFELQQPQHWDLPQIYNEAEILHLPQQAEPAACSSSDNVIQQSSAANSCSCEDNAESVLLRVSPSGGRSPASKEVKSRCGSQDREDCVSGTSGCRNCIATPDEIQHNKLLTTCE